MESDVRGRMLKVIGIIFFVAICLYLVLLYAVPTVVMRYETARQEQEMEKEREREKLLALTGMDLVSMANEENSQAMELVDELDFALPFGCTGNVIKVTGGFEEREYVVTIPYADENYMLDKNVSGDLEIIKDISYKYENHKGVITVSLNNMYEYTTDYDENSFRLILVAPKQIYKKIILIDAGSGETEEINRDIVMRLKEKLDEEIECGIFYSGLEEFDYRSDAKNRQAFADDVCADYIISVQMNHTASHKMSAINGTQVAYQPDSSKSKELADVFQSLIVEGIESSDKGVLEMSDEDVYKDNKACAVVIMPGFMTNKLDMDYVNSPENRQKIADIIYEGLLTVMEE